MSKMKANDFITMAKKAASCKTLYIKGCFGAPMSATNKKRYSSNNAYNKANADKINSASTDTFGFDCVNLLKGILWGWNADKNKVYGGASYTSNGVPDIGENAMIKLCTEVSTDFKKITPGEMLWLDGHAGIYVGDGLAIEATPAWKNGVQYSAVANIGAKSGYNSRKWTKHGKLPYVDYATAPTPKPTPTPTPSTGFKLGDKCKLKAGARYSNNKPIPSWVFQKVLYVRAISGNNITVSWLKEGAVTGTVNKLYLNKI